MPYVYAGLWGPDAFTDSYGNTLTGATLTVYRAGTLTAATLYTDQSKATVSLNPVSPDPYGNFKFWTDPGLYDLNLNYQGQVAQTIPAVLVSVNPLEAAGVTIPDGSITGGPAAIGVKLAQTTITHDNVATANKDGLVGIPSLRTIGTGALQAMAGNDTRVVQGAILNPGPLTGAVAATRYVGGNASGIPTTGTFAVGDHTVDQDGTAWVCVTAGTPGSWKPLGSQPWQFFPETYGAKGDNTTDDTPAINSAVSAAVTYAQANSGYCEVVFGAKVYLVSSATIKGGATQGNAQIPIPKVLSTANKVTLTFKGPGDASALLHWQQITPQRSGAVIRCTLTGQTLDGTWGAPSVIGGPTAITGNGGFNNMLIVIDGIEVVCPFNPSLTAFDFRQMGEANIPSGAAMADASPAGSPLLTTIPTNSLGTGLAMPGSSNNDNCNIGKFSVEGFYYGYSISEHFSAQRISATYCNTAIYINVPNAAIHGAVIGYASIEACSHVFWADGNPNSQYPVFFGLLDDEAITIDHINDQANALIGEIHWADFSVTDPIVVGAGKLNIVNERRKIGNVAAPAVPATTVALKNPFWRNAAVNITGGTVSVIAVDGVATGFTATGATVIVPSGRTITLTYTVAPSWNWTLL